MNFYDLLSLFGGLALFLYGMKLMEEGLQESASGSLKRLMERVTNNTFKAFLLGIVVTALIQSSNATILITSGMVAAGVISLKQSLGIIIGANVGTTITGQIIRLMDINASGWLQLLQPSTLAPIALIIGVVFVFFINIKNAKYIGHIILGFGVLFTGLMNMTSAVDTLSSSGVFQSLFQDFASTPILGFLTGLMISVILQSASASVGILQAISSSGELTFYTSYTIILGIYTGVSLVTGILCIINEKADSKRVGLINILFNIYKILIIILGVFLLSGMTNDITMTSGHIADMNTLFNLLPAILFIPFLSLSQKVSEKVIKDDEVQHNYLIEALNPQFFNTPALAFKASYDVLLEMYHLAYGNIKGSLKLLRQYDEKEKDIILKQEKEINNYYYHLTQYLGSFSGVLLEETHLSILNQYNKTVAHFERLSDHSINILEVAQYLRDNDLQFTDTAFEELSVLEEGIDKILEYALETFEHRNVEAAYAIEPLEEVIDYLIKELEERHTKRIVNKECDTYAGIYYMNVLRDLERIGDICENIGEQIIERVHPEESYDYKKNYRDIYEQYFERLK